MPDSQLDELQKLAELKNQGVITEKEFNKKKKAIMKGSKNPRWWLRIPLMLVGFYLLMNALSNIRGVPNETASIPACTSSDAAKFLAQTFDQSQHARENSLSAVDIRGAKEISKAKDNKKTQCESTIVMNNTEKMLVVYDMSERDGKLWLEFKSKK